MHAMDRSRFRPAAISVLAATLLLVQPSIAAAVTRCTAPYDPAGTQGAGTRTMVRSAPAIRWLRAVYGEPTDHLASAATRKNVLRGYALRPCAQNRGALTIWTTNPPAMIRRAWRQPWIYGIDIQWVRVRYGSNDAMRAVRAATTPAMLAAIEAHMGAPLTTAGDSWPDDAIRIGIDTTDIDALPSDANAWMTKQLGMAATVELEEPARLVAARSVVLDPE